MLTIHLLLFATKQKDLELDFQVSAARSVSRLQPACITEKGNGQEQVLFFGGEREGGLPGQLFRL